MNKIYFILPLAVLVLNACGYSDTEKQAAEIACACSEDQTMEGVRDCIRSAADSMKIDVQALSYDRAFKAVCPDTYLRIMNFAKGKTKGRDEVPEKE